MTAELGSVQVLCPSCGEPVWVTALARPLLQLVGGSRAIVRLEAEWEHRCDG